MQVLHVDNNQEQVPSQIFHSSLQAKVGNSLIIEPSKIGIRTVSMVRKICTISVVVDCEGG